MHLALCWDRMNKEVVNGAVSNCQCLPLSFEGLLSEESGCKGFRHLSPCDLNESLYCPVLNQVTVQLALIVTLHWENNQSQGSYWKLPELTNAQKRKKP